jgi:hypothetical protein
VTWFTLNNSNLRSQRVQVFTRILNLLVGSVELSMESLVFTHQLFVWGFLVSHPLSTKREAVVTRSSVAKGETLSIVDRSHLLSYRGTWALRQSNRPLISAW